MNNMVATVKPIKTKKKVRAKDPEWLKIKAEESENEKKGSEEDIESEGKNSPAKPEDERKLKRIAAFKQR